MINENNIKSIVEHVCVKLEINEKQACISYLSALMSIMHANFILPSELISILEMNFTEEETDEISLVIHESIYHLSKLAIKND